MSEGSGSNGSVGNGSVNGSGNGSLNGAENGSGHGAGDGGDDFYATVSASAGASRSTRIKHGESGSAGAAGPSAPSESSSRQSGAESWTEPHPVGGSSDSAWARPSQTDAQTEPGRRAQPDGPVGSGVAHDQSQASGEVPAADEASGDKPAGKSWRDRWSSLTASMTGKQPKVDATGTPQQTDEGPPATDELTDGAKHSSDAQHASDGQGDTDVPAGKASPGRFGKKQSPYELATARLYGSPETTAPARQAQPEDPATAVVPVAAGAAGGAGAVAGATAVKNPEAAVVAAPDAAAPKPKAGAARRTRKARLRLSRLDPWSVMKTAFLFSIAAGIVMVVAVYVVWTVIGSSGLFASINDIVGSVVSTPGDTTPFRVEEYVNTQKVMGVTAFLACIDVVIFTALATLASFLYNLAATMLGGLEVTLAED